MASAAPSAKSDSGAQAINPQVLAVYVTVSSKEEGVMIAAELVKRKLAACCNIIPGLTSIYEWEGKVCQDDELLLMIKTTRPALDRLTKAVQAIHSYDECEVIAVPITGGSQTYLDWVVKSVVHEIV